MSASTTTPRHAPDARQLLNKVPEVTVWFWVIKILCTTVGESFADWINMQLGVGLVNTAWIFTAVFAATLTWQLRTKRYVPFVYWLNVVVVSVTGTLYTDILTDQKGVPLWISSTIFSAVLAVVFGIWYSRERTLSIHSIVTFPREAFYWLAVLVTFALGTATGDWTLELTGWGPGKAVLLPLALIAIVSVLWRFGMNAVLSFWVAYILTRPLGANIGDFLGSPHKDHGLGLGTFVTSILFLGAILATVIFLTVTKSDVIETYDATHTPVVTTNLRRERLAGAVLALVAMGTGGLLTWANNQPHVSALDDAPAPTCKTGKPLNATQAKTQVAQFPSAKVAGYRKIATDSLALVKSGDQSGAKTRIKDLETAWDADQAALQPKNCQAWTYVDQQIDPVLSSIRASKPNQVTEEHALNSLLTTLG
ncbi:hypothetical protein [Nocardioides marmorisolisilvae]|uniref:Membrane-anchored protein n=1 Tax=Nocardioides marmorisolisilvae TaxID=1542737 RepID=A0A3N0DTH1_9ACTN|nr:hypothetical protein [Nocardioides marmorisolisilvae]RNL78935.1 hypothetical protein EFL95_07750 [Nocardioides marmorisolisilvae]